MGKSRPLGRVGNEKLITDFLGRMWFSRSLYTARSVAVHGSSVAVHGSSVAACGSFGHVGIRVGERGDAGLDAVLQVYQTYTWRRSSRARTVIGQKSLRLSDFTPKLTIFAA